MIDPDRWYTCKEFAVFIGVHPLTIYQSQTHLASPRLPLHVPPGISLGRAKRWDGRSISKFQQDLAALSGVELETAAASAPAAPLIKKGGRPPKDKKVLDKALKLYDAQAHSISEICGICGIAQGTLYKAVNDRKGVRA